MNSWDTDSNKSFDFLLNPICIVVVFCVVCILDIYYTNKISFNQLKELNIGGQSLLRFPVSREYDSKVFVNKIHLTICCKTIIFICLHLSQNAQYTMPFKGPCQLPIVGPTQSASDVKL